MRTRHRAVLCAYRSYSWSWCLLLPSLFPHPTQVKTMAAAWPPTATAAAHANLRVGLAIYEVAMDHPVIRTIAQQHWDSPESWWHPPMLAPWLIKCRQCVGHSMKQYVVEESSWDASTLGAICKSNLAVFIPPSIRGDDAAMEMYRYTLTRPSLDTHHACVALNV